MQTVAGQLTFRRAVSKKLVFYDMLCTTQGPDGEQAWLEIVVKEGIYGTVQQVKDLRDSLKLGDHVSVLGHFEGERVLQAAAVTVQQAWRDSIPGMTFRPQPSPLHAAHAPTPQRQQTRQQGQQQGQQLGQQQGQEESGQTAPAVELAGSSEQDVRATGGAEEPASAAYAASAGVVQEPCLAVCKYWVNTGSCSKGAACPHAHLQTGALQRRWITHMRSERQLLSSSMGFAHSGSAAAKGRRAHVFAAWLLQKFGREGLNAGAGVLDVAGGAGGMTFELNFVHGIKCTLVDPRPLKLNKQQQRQLQQAGLAVAIHTMTAEQLQLPQGQKGHCGPNPDTSPDQNPGAGSEPAALHLHQVQALFEPQLWRSAGWRARFGGGSDALSLALGLHPDQATDAILDFALEAGTPFAIVPCCVFARLFPERRLHRPDSNEVAPVLTYSDLIEFLASKGEGKREVLDFEGANTVVWGRRGGWGKGVGLIDGAAGAPTVQLAAPGMTSVQASTLSSSAVLHT